MKLQKGKRNNSVHNKVICVCEHIYIHTHTNFYRNSYYETVLQPTDRGAQTVPVASGHPWQLAHQIYISEEKPTPTSFC